MVKTLTEMTTQTGVISKIATKLTERAEANQKKSSIKMAQDINDVMIELSTSQGIIGAAILKALKIK